MSVEKTIHRIIKDEGNFSIIPNKVSQGLIYYPEALALYVYMFSLPPQWEFLKIHLQKVSNLGRNKLDHVLKKLVAHGLVEFAQKRDAHGKFAQIDTHVKDGSYFKINNLEKFAQPRTGLPLTASRLPVNSTYKENKINKQRTKKETLKNYCASDDARTEIEQASFDDFWRAYPRKKDKARAKKIWSSKKCHLLSSEILEDIKNRTINEAQWQDEQYIPHPSTYLRNNLWEDEITLKKKKPERESHFEMMQRVFSENDHNERNSYND